MADIEFIMELLELACDGLAEGTSGTDSPDEFRTANMHVRNGMHELQRHKDKMSNGVGNR